MGGSASRGVGGSASRGVCLRGSASRGGVCLGGVFCPGGLHPEGVCQTPLPPTPRSAYGGRLDRYKNITFLQLLLRAVKIRKSSGMKENLNIVSCEVTTRQYTLHADKHPSRFEGAYECSWPTNQRPSDRLWQEGAHF